MSHVISVAVTYAIYEVEDDVFEFLSNGEFTDPPLIVLEAMHFSGKAKRVGTVGSMVVSAGQESESEDEEPPEGEGPWME